MAIANIKSDFHHLIDKIENEELLKAFYTLLSGQINGSKGNLWNELTPEEQQELIVADEESKNPDNWISNEVAKKNHIKLASK